MFLVAFLRLLCALYLLSFVLHTCACSSTYTPSFFNFAARISTLQRAAKPVTSATEPLIA